MHVVAFRTEFPVGAVQRALDELDRAGFALLALTLETDAAGASICIRYGGAANVPAASYLARLTRMPALFDVTGHSTGHSETPLPKVMPS